MAPRSLEINYQEEMSQPLNAVDRLRLWVSDPDTFDQPDFDDAEELIEYIDQLEAKLK